MAAGDKVTILFSEVMFDKNNGISAENPNIIEFIYEKAEIFKEWGYDVKILHSDKDYLDVFHHRLTRSPDKNRIGMKYGFMLSRRCSLKRDCKIKPINDWLKSHSSDSIQQYIGIAIDEPKRLLSLHKEGKISLLEKYRYTEKMCMELCSEHDMLSPQYSGLSNRSGCWCCPNSKFEEKLAISEKYPEAWEKYVSLEQEKNLAYPKWNVFSKETLYEIDMQIRARKGLKI